MTPDFIVLSEGISCSDAVWYNWTNNINLIVWKDSDSSIFMHWLIDIETKSFEFIIRFTIDIRTWSPRFLNDKPLLTFSDNLKRIWVGLKRAED